MNFSANFSNFFDKGKTFRPKKKFQPGTLKYSLHKQAQASLNSGINLRQVSLLVSGSVCRLFNTVVIWLKGSVYLLNINQFIQVVLLPKGEDFNDWLAVHVVDFFNRINLIYGTVCEQCTNTTCPTMSGGPKYEYLWQDGVKYKKPTQLPANQVLFIY